MHLDVPARTARSLQHFGRKLIVILCRVYPQWRVLSVGWQLVSDWRGLGNTAYLSGGEVLPLRHGGGAAGFVCLTVNEMAFGIKMIMKAGMNRSEFL